MEETIDFRRRMTHETLILEIPWGGCRDSTERERLEVAIVIEAELRAVELRDEP